MSKKHSYLVHLILTAILSSVSVVLGRFFSYNVQDFSIGLAFLPIMVCGMLAGPLWGGICGALSDLVGALLFPFGAYFPGFTAVAFLMGALYGLIGIADRKSKKRLSFFAVTLGAVFISEFVGSLLLNSLWLSVMYGMPYPTELLLRLPEVIAYFTVKTAAAILLSLLVLPRLRKNIKRS